MLVKGAEPIAATGDLHFGKSSVGTLQPLMSQIATSADVVVVAGDLTDYGHPDEARALVKDLTALVRGEQIVKLFVHEAVNERLKLESALARLRTDKMTPDAPFRILEI